MLNDLSCVALYLFSELPKGMLFAVANFYCCVDAQAESPVNLIREAPAARLLYIMPKLGSIQISNTFFEHFLA